MNQTDATQAGTEAEAAPDMEKIIARIQKLLTRTKTDRGSTEAEADTAMKMAQELMSKYNLDMAVIEASQAGANAPAERVKEEVKGRAMYKWQRQLAKYVSESNFCYHLIKTDENWVETYYKLDKEFKSEDLPKQITNSEYWDMPYSTHHKYTRIDGRYNKTYQHVFVGRKANVITAQLMYQYLTQTIEDLVPVENKDRLSRSAMSWKEGCADRLCERLAKRRQDLIDQHDARVKAEQADARAEFDRRRAEQAEKLKKVLPPHHESEVKAAFDGIAEGAYDETDNERETEEPERPEAEDGETPWTPGDNAEDIAEPEAGTAMVLASVYDQSERDANYELAKGLEPGTLARWKAEREEAARKYAEEAAKEEVEEVEKPVKQETERQRRAREKREAEQWAKDRRRWAREDATEARRAQREYERRDQSMYRAGAAKGKDIGLDGQLKAGTESKKLK